MATEVEVRVSCARLGPRAVGAPSCLLLRPITGAHLKDVSEARLKDVPEAICI